MNNTQICEAKHHASSIYDNALKAMALAGTDGNSGHYLNEIDRSCRKLADALGYDVSRRPVRETVTNTAPSERALSADDLADRAYDDRREEAA